MPIEIITKTTRSRMTTPFPIMLSDAQALAGSVANEQFNLLESGQCAAHEFEDFIVRRLKWAESGFDNGGITSLSMTSDRQNQGFQQGTNQQQDFIELKNGESFAKIVVRTNMKRLLFMSFHDKKEKLKSFQLGDFCGKTARSKCKEIVFELQPNEYLAGFHLRKDAKKADLFNIQFVFIEKPKEEEPVDEKKNAAAKKQDGQQAEEDRQEELIDKFHVQHFGQIIRCCSRIQLVDMSNQVYVKDIAPEKFQEQNYED